jgi:nucleoside-diphosphate-sugar epimerase
MSTPRALVIGGTGPTGPFIVEGLYHRKYAVTILHGGQHEVEFAVPNVQHIHEDPHFAETLQRGLGSTTYDLVIAQYGRLKVIAEALRGKVGRLVAIGGATAIYSGDEDERWGKIGRPALIPDTSTLFVQSASENKLGFRMVEAMNTLFQWHPQATYIGYPVNYGPRTPGPHDWAIVKRILDGRRAMVIADGGIKLESRVHTENAANAVLGVVDNPLLAAGKRYSVADRDTYSMRQRIEFVARHMRHELELIDIPWQAAWPCWPLWRHTRDHRLCQSALIRAELGYADKVSADVALGRSVDWLVDNRPEPGGEAEQQVGDPFDYASEDALIDRWRDSLMRFGPLAPPVTEASHQYRHPKQPGESWQPPRVR